MVYGDRKCERLQINDRISFEATFARSACGSMSLGSKADHVIERWSSHAFICSHTSLGFGSMSQVGRRRQRQRRKALKNVRHDLITNSIEWLSWRVSIFGLWASFSLPINSQRFEKKEKTEQNKKEIAKTTTPTIQQVFVDFFNNRRMVVKGSFHLKHHSWEFSHKRDASEELMGTTSLSWNAGQFSENVNHYDDFMLVAYTIHFIMHFFTAVSVEFECRS